jgi:hypothetical protein
VAKIKKSERKSRVGSPPGTPQIILPRQPPMYLCLRQELSGVPQISNLETFWLNEGNLLWVSIALCQAREIECGQMLSKVLICTPKRF